MLPVIFYAATATGSLQAGHLNYIHYSTNNSGLPHNITYGICQDSRDYLWIGTDNGLVRFDGTNMRLYEKGLESKYVIDMDESGGKLWVCTWKGGIYQVQGDSVVQIREKDNRNTLYNTNKIIVCDNQVVSFVFEEYFVHCYDPQNHNLVPAVLHPGHAMTQSYKPGDAGYLHFQKTVSGKLFAFDDRYFYRMSGGKLIPQQTGVHPELTWESPDGTLYFLRDSLIYRMDERLQSAGEPISFARSRLGLDKLFSFFVLQSGNIVLGQHKTGTAELSERNIYSIYSVHTHTITDIGRSINENIFPADVCIDREGSIWMSSDGQGLYHIFDPRYRQVGDDDHFFRNPFVLSLYRDSQDSIWIGTKSGLYMMHANRGKEIPGFEQLYVHKIGAEISGRTCVYGSVYREQNAFVFNKKNGNTSCERWYPEYYATPHYVLFPSENGRFHLFLRQNGAPCVLDTHIVFPLRAVTEDSRGHLWILNSRHLVRYISGKKDQCFPSAFFGGENLLCLLAENNLWLGSTRGLYELRNDGRIVHYGQRLGFPEVQVNCMQRDSSGILWLGTAHGLIRFDGKRMQLFKKRDGLIADDVMAMCLLPGNQLLLGSSGGLTFFNTGDSIYEPVVPQLYIESILVNNQVSGLPFRADIPYRASLQVVCNVVTFTYPELTSIEYRLQKTDDWINTTNRTLVFSNLSPGMYDLEMRVKNYNAGYTPIQRIRFRIASPWWQSPVFTVMVLILIPAAWVFWKYRKLDRQKKQQTLRRELAELRLKALQAQLNPHFISNTLNAIQYYILKQDEQAASVYLSCFSELTRMFLDISRCRFIRLSEELEMLQNYAALEQMRMGEKLQFRLDVAKEIIPDRTYIPGLLIQPFVENSIHHGIAGLPEKYHGQVSVTVFIDQDMLVIAIEDNGIGREKARTTGGEGSRRYRSRSGAIIGELLQTYNALPGCRIVMEVTDKTGNDGLAEGTTVIIRMNYFREEPYLELKSAADDSHSYH